MSGNGFVMAAVVKELYIDLIRGRVDVITAVDLHIAINRLLDTNQISTLHILLLNSYSAGYTLDELQSRYPQAEDMLIQILALLEAESGYSDDELIQRAIRIKPYHSKLVDVHRSRLYEWGRKFDDELFYDRQGT